MLVVDKEEVEDALEQDVASYQVAVTMQLLEADQVVVSPKSPEATLLLLAVP